MVIVGPTKHFSYGLIIPKVHCPLGTFHYDLRAKSDQEAGLSIVRKAQICLVDVVASVERGITSQTGETLASFGVDMIKGLRTFRAENMAFKVGLSAPTENCATESMPACSGNSHPP